jgi:hypothetical protein
MERSADERKVYFQINKSVVNKWISKGSLARVKLTTNKKFEKDIDGVEVTGIVIMKKKKSF